MTTFTPTAILALLACVSCGSSSSSALFSGHGAATGTDAGARGGGAPGGGGRAPGSGGAFAFAGNSASGGAGGSLSQPDSSLGSGGTLSVPDAAGPLADGGAPLGTPTPGTIICAGMPCTIAGVPTNTCCVGLPPFPTACFPSFPGCVNAGIAAIGCDDAADCQNGQICCGNLTGQNTGSRCATTCSNPSVQVCRTNAECPSHRCERLAQAKDYGACK